MNQSFRKFYNRNRPAVALTIVILFFAVILMLPVKYEYRINVPGKILAGQEWLITVSGNGQVMTALHDRILGVTKHLALQQFDRQDIMQLRLKNGLAEGTIIKPGDTIGFILSSEMDKNIEHLRGELSGYQAELERVKTGSKLSVINEAARSVEFAEAQYDQIQKEFIRQQQLFNRNIVSQQEFEIAERKLKAAKISIDIEKARLLTVSTGAKDEEIKVINSKIIALQNDIRLLEKKAREYCLISPINGKLTQYGSLDTLLSVTALDTFVVIMPVQITDRKYLATLSQVRLQPYDSDILPTASIARIDNNIALMRGSQVYLTTALFNSSLKNLHGLMTECAIECGQINGLEYLKRQMHSMLK